MTQLVDIPGYEGRYAITDDGNVWSYPKFKINHPDGSGYMTKGRWLTNINDRDGYYCVSFDNKTFKIHRLVGLTYLPNPLNRPQINHINGIKSDNAISNLEWVTNKENSEHYLKVLKKGKRVNKKRQ